MWAQALLVRSLNCKIREERERPKKRKQGLEKSDKDERRENKTPRISKAILFISPIETRPQN